jgi:hypothetical protein
MAFISRDLCQHISMIRVRFISLRFSKALLTLSGRALEAKYLLQSMGIVTEVRLLTHKHSNL